MKYRELLDNFLNIVWDYIEEVRSDKPLPGITISSDSDSIHFYIDPESKEFYGIGEKFRKGREVAIEILKLVKLIIEDEVLSRAVEFTISDVTFGEICVHFRKEENGKIKVEVRIPTKIFKTSSIEECISYLEEVDEKIRKFENLIDDLEKKLNEIGSYSHFYYEADLSELNEVVSYLMEIKERAIRAGFDVEEKIYLWKFDQTSESSICKTFSSAWRVIGHKFEIVVELTANYFSEEFVRKLLTLKKLTLEDLVNFDAEPRSSGSNGVDLDREVCDPKLLEVASAHLIHGMEL